MMRLLTVKQLQVQIATGGVGKALKKLPGQPKAKRGRHILTLLVIADFLVAQLVQFSPNQIGPAAEIDDASRKGFIHRQIRLPVKGFFG